MAKRKINVALIGYKFMGKAHSHAYKDVSMFFDCPVEPVMKVLCGREEEGLRAAAERYGWESYETDWHRIIERDDIDLIDIAGSNALHYPVVMAAAQAGKHVFCEKPLAASPAEAQAMVDAVGKAGVKHMVNFNYRKCPAVQLAKQLIDQGEIGRIFHVRAQFLQDWIVDPNFPLVWRLTEPGAGSLGDLGAHIIDMARFFVGEFAEVVATQETFIKERPEAASSSGITATATNHAAKGEEAAPLGKVTVDDGTAFLVRFENGAIGTFEASRFCPGHDNYLWIEVNGSEGSFIFNFERMNELQFFSKKDPKASAGFRTINATQAVHSYMEAWWPPAHIIGYEHAFVHQVYDFMKAIAEDTMPTPNFVDGLETQRILSAVERSADDRAWVTIGR